MTTTNHVRGEEEEEELELHEVFMKDEEEEDIVEDPKRPLYCHRLSKSMDDTDGVFLLVEDEEATEKDPVSLVVDKKKKKTNSHLLYHTLSQSMDAGMDAFLLEDDTISKSGNYIPRRIPRTGRRHPTTTTTTTTTNNTNENRRASYTSSLSTRDFYPYRPDVHKKKQQQHLSSTVHGEGVLLMKKKHRSQQQQQQQQPPKIQDYHSAKQYIQTMQHDLKKYHPTTNKNIQSQPQQQQQQQQPIHQLFRYNNKKINIRTEKVKLRSTSGETKRTDTTHGPPTTTTTTATKAASPPPPRRRRRRRADPNLTTEKTTWTRVTPSTADTLFSKNKKKHSAIPNHMKGESNFKAAMNASFQESLQEMCF